ncbi:MAG: endonuclease III [Candidatus Diapherotrites archaeon]|nr:endonuclease III [Candidatus Diapherotrites archaeon]
MVGVIEKNLAGTVFSLLENKYQKTHTTLCYSNPLEILVATILSAQCTDKRINKVTKELFKKYVTVDDYADADISEFEKDIKSTGFYRNKAKNIKETSRIIREEFDSEVPGSMQDLLGLPGVGRKTANVVLLNAFGAVEGIAVDTHVKRLSFRLGFSSSTSPENIERDLVGLFPKNKWGLVSDLIIAHGRQVCTARKPSCNDCVISKLCPSAFSFK